MEYSDIQLAAHLKVNCATAFRWRKSGCPTNDLEAATQWAENRKPTTTKLKAEVLEDVAPIPVNGETAYDVRDRLQAQEQSISAEIVGLNAALQQARSANDELKAYKLLQALKSAREEHRRQADSLLKSEGRIILLERSRGLLISLDSSKEFVSKCINPLAIWIKKLPDSGRNSDEKSLLEVLCAAGMEVVRTSAREALEFTGK
jgi:hypothetical protein